MITPNDIQEHKDKLDAVKQEMMNTFQTYLTKVEEESGSATVQMALLPVAAQLFTTAVVLLNDATHRFAAEAPTTPEIKDKVRQLAVEEIVETFNKMVHVVEGVKQNKSTDDILAEVMIQTLMSHALASARPVDQE